MSDEDFYTSISLSPDTHAVDHWMQAAEEDSYYNQVRALTDHEREKKALALPVEAGVRVAFTANLGSVLYYDYVPEDGTHGSVVMVRTAAGDTTYVGDQVFVKWDDGYFMPVHHHHLRPVVGEKTANTFSMRMADLGDISTLFASDEKTGDLIHKSTQDLWSLEQRDSGYVISRLFDDTGEPLKV